MSGISMQQVGLEKLRLMIFAQLSDALANDLANMPKVELSALARFRTDQVLMRIQIEVLGRELERIECSYPADWWQAFKARWFPRWLRERFPVIYVHKKLVARELYPKVALPDKGPVVALELVG